jgi:hypothetical protein
LELVNLSSCSHFVPSRVIEANCRHR